MHLYWLFLTRSWEAQYTYHRLYQAYSAQGCYRLIRARRRQRCRQGHQHPDPHLPEVAEEPGSEGGLDHQRSKMLATR